MGAQCPATLSASTRTTGFGLVQALARVDLPALDLGTSAAVQPGERVVMGGAGGRQHSVAARIVAKQEFAGYWEYLLDEAIFTAPAHPYWGGTALIGAKGELIGIGSLRLEQSREAGRDDHLNMVVPIDLLKPILDDILTIGRPRRPPRPWLGLYAVEVDDNVVIAGMAETGPSAKAGLNTGDLVVGVAGEPVESLAAFFRQIWSLGEAGVTVPLTIARDGDTLDLAVKSADRGAFSRHPSCTEKK